jgi:hypothetical protein
LFTSLTPVFFCCPVLRDHGDRCRRLTLAEPEAVARKH